MRIRSHFVLHRSTNHYIQPSFIRKAHRELIVRTAHHRRIAQLTGSRTSACRIAPPRRITATCGRCRVEHGRT